MRPKEINIEWTPAETDRFLQENYGYSLWHFACSFIRNSFIWRDYREDGNIKTLKKGKKELEKNLDKFRKYPFPYSSYKYINEAIKEIDKTLNSQNMQGAPSKRLNIIALIWSYFIKDTHKIHLANISGLLEWFNDKTENSEFFVSFFREIENLNNKKLGKLIDRHKRKNTYAKAVEEGMRIFKNPAKNIAILFRNNEAEEILLDKFERGKNTPFISFPNGEILAIEDFEKNKATNSRA